MSSNIKLWWNNEKISWYIRAANRSDFHKSIICAISEFIPKSESIADLGCGLGYLTNEFATEGYSIYGYDIDERAINKATEIHKRDIFKKCDCYTLDNVADNSIALFFGKLTEDKNYEILLRTSRKRLIYITGGGSKRRTSDDEIKRFLDSKGAVYRKKEITLSFDQPLIDKREADKFLVAYYTGTVLEYKKMMIEPYSDNEFHLILRNKKEITIYEINKEKMI